MSANRIFILTGGSGVGKTTLGEFLETLGIPQLISHTTRPKRKGEVEGKNYYFVDMNTFLKLEKIEFTEYPKNSGNYYCLSKKEIDDKLSKYGQVYAVTDKYGIEQLKEKYGNVVKVIYITCPLSEMEKRMRARGDSEEQIQKRLKQAIETNELNNHHLADYVIENLDLEESKRQLVDILEQEMPMKVKVN